MSVELFNVIFLVENGANVIQISFLWLRLATLACASQVKRKINHTLLTVQIFSLVEFNFKK